MSLHLGSTWEGHGFLIFIKCPNASDIPQIEQNQKLKMNKDLSFFDVYSSDFEDWPPWRQ